MKYFYIFPLIFIVGCSTVERGVAKFDTKMENFFKERNE